MSEVCVACTKSTASGNHHCSVCNGVVHSAVISFTDYYSSQREFCAFPRKRSTQPELLTPEEKAAEDNIDESTVDCARCVHQLDKEAHRHTLPQNYDMKKSIFCFENVHFNTATNNL